MASNLIIVSDNVKAFRQNIRRPLLEKIKYELVNSTVEEKNIENDINAPGLTGTENPRSGAAND